MTAISFQRLKPIAESAKDIVVGRATSQAEEGVHINREVRSDLINQTGVECANPWLIATRAFGIVKFDVAAEVPDDRARQPDGICHCMRMLLLPGWSRMSILV